MFHRKEHGGSPARNADLVVNVLQVMRSCLFTDDEGLSNLAVAGSFSHVSQDLNLAVSKSGWPFAPTARFGYNTVQLLRQGYETLGREE